jgi:thiamine biosynthesis lipoprotein
LAKFLYILSGMKSLLSLILPLLLVFGCTPTPHTKQKHFSKSGQFFGSIMKVDVCYNENQSQALNQAIDAIWSRFADIHWRLSTYDPDSDMNRINHSLSQPVTVGADTYGLIKDSLYYHQFSDQEFDITVYPLIKLWKTAQKRNALPTPAEIQEAQKHMGMDRIKLLNKNQVQLLTPAPSLTIDSIADGYAADETARILRAYGFTNFLVDATGELYGGGHNCEGKFWNIGVQDPQNPGAIIDIIQIENTSVTTSGNYEHFYTINGKQYSHIISPKTGFPRADILSATVIAPSTEFSDFWSTALCLIDPQRGIELIDSLGEGYASMVIVTDSSGEIHNYSSQNYKKYLVVSR